MLPIVKQGDECGLPKAIEDLLDSPLEPSAYRWRPGCLEFIVEYLKWTPLVVVDTKVFGI